MPALQKQQYLSSLLDVYEPIAEALNAPATSPFAPGVIQQVRPIQRAELQIRPPSSQPTVPGAPPTVLTAAKNDVDPSGGLRKLYTGPHFVADLEPSTSNGQPFLGAQWADHVTS
jgi:hypothetical protein